ncbi:hypothetical protein [[Phormidium] sp. ETS-05]|uniref:hypothetical protein n=1 Tax=[Phormidium] sp. ETS-05 TaxID=222819 RepID=UPI0018EEFD7F|nr:hypothetical protein [[Phormidium] sp. ETS-05]
MLNNFTIDRDVETVRLEAYNARAGIDIDSRLFLATQTQAGQGFPGSDRLCRQRKITVLLVFVIVLLCLFQ